MTIMTKDATHHGRNQMDSSSMSPAHLRDITRSVIDKQYLDNRVYREFK